MNRPAVLALVAALVLLLAIGVGAWLLAPGGGTKGGGPSGASRSAVEHSEGSSQVGGRAGSPEEASDDATSGAADAGEVIDVALGAGGAKAGGAGGDGGAALGLPPVDTGAVDDLCEALEASQRRLGTSRVMMEKMPEKSRGSVGAKKLRIVHDRLEKEVERYERRAKARGECGV